MSQLNLVINRSINNHADTRWPKLLACYLISYSWSWIKNSLLSAGASFKNRSELRAECEVPQYVNVRAEGDKLLHGLQHQSQRSQSCCLASQPSCLPISFPFSQRIISAMCLMIVLLLVITFQTRRIIFCILNILFRNMLNENMHGFS